MRSKKNTNPFNVKIEPVRMPRIRISPELLRLIAERRRNRK